MPLSLFRPFVLLLPAALPAISGAPVRAESPEAYLRHALTHDGDAGRGQVLFSDSRLLCANCHSVDGTAAKAGPDLHAAGEAFGRRDVVESLLRPSAVIAPGYGTVFLKTTDGIGYQGILKQKSEAGVELMGADGLLIRVAQKDIGEMSGIPGSLMPEGLYNNLSLQEFTDVIEYLTTLKQAESALVKDHGMPAEMPELARPVEVTPFFAEPFRLPRGKAGTGLTSMRQVPGRPGVFLVLHQKGTVWRVEKTSGGDERTVFAELPDEVFSDRGPNGLLDVAFHPQFRENRKYYLFYQVFEEGSVATHIVEKEFDAGFENDSGRPPRLILKITSVAEDHSGGCLEFGPDGFLYLVMGDTGPHNDPNGHAQNLGLLLGKMMRIDVDHSGNGLAYGIPADNPFVGHPGARPEIWAYGLRNPWRFCFDRLTGELWLADVGQDRVEEVDIVKRGDNHGWNVFEGFEPFSNQFRRAGETFTKPVFAYRRKYGSSITGGHVFRGDPQSSFYGVYVFADYTSRRLFGLTAEHGILKVARQIGTVPQRVVSFSEDEAGNLYAVGYEGGIYRLDFTPGRFE